MEDRRQSLAEIDTSACKTNRERKKMKIEENGKKIRMREVINPDFWFRIMRAVQKIAKIVLHFFLLRRHFFCFEKKLNNCSARLLEPSNNAFTTVFALSADKQRR